MFSYLFSVTYLVPEEYSTIQLGIDAAVDGDTVLVNQGIYYENIHLTKSIVLSSYAIFDNLDQWSDYNSNIDQWQINNDNIINTIIDGGMAIDDYGSCVLIYSPSGDCISPEIKGFTIQNGIGTMIDRDGEQQRLGGGILFDISNPTISFNQIIDNGSAEVFSGGATYGTSMEEDWSFNNRDLNGRARCEIDEFNLANNLYNGNDALNGNTFANIDFEENINLTGSIFDVFDCVSSGGGLTSVWMDIESNAVVDLDSGAGQLCFITDNNVYVQSNISDECLSDNTCGYQENPFKTIKRTLEMINPTVDNPITIHLSNGTFSPETGEEFPVILPSYANLIGENEISTILDAQGTIAVMMLNRTFGNSVSDFTIKGGNFNNNGSLLWHKSVGGIYLRYPISPNLSNLTITQNIGSGLYIEGENPVLTNITITENDAEEESGGGIFCRATNLTLTNVIISDNSARRGGGIDCDMLDQSTFKNVLITENIVSCNSENDDGECGDGSAIALSGFDDDDDDDELTIRSEPQLIFENVTISRNIGENGGALYMENFINPIIINSIIWDNYPASTSLFNTQPIISYSNIAGGWEGENNIDIDPLFIDAENGNFSLQNNSPCKDTGNPNLWYNDLNDSHSDMGATGGLFILPNFTEYNFQEVGNFGSNREFVLYNYRENPITIIDVSFGTSIFSTNTIFPLILEPSTSGAINIQVDNSIIGFIEDNMIISSQDLPDNISVFLSSIGVDGNILSGNLSGTYPSGIYRINGSLAIDSEDIVTLQPGTQFLFDGDYGFNINGTLQAIGTEADSIIFDNYSNENDKWVGFLLDSVDDGTIFEYVRISGVHGIFEPSINGGGAMGMMDSSPIMNHVKINNNIGLWGAGIAMGWSSPTLNNVIISNNNSESWGGGLYIVGSNPTLNNVIVSGNTSNQFGGGINIDGCGGISLDYVQVYGNIAEQGGGIYIGNSVATLNNVTVNDNYAQNDGSCTANEEEGESCGVGGGIYVTGAMANLINVTISGNIAETFGGGTFFRQAGGLLINDILWGNSPESINIDNASVQVYHTNIQGGWESIGAVGENIGNINIDPMFTNSENGDYTLQEDSPCIDTGLADLEETGIANITNYYGMAPDMGAYEFYGGGSIIGDINLDGIVNVNDIVAVVNIIIGTGSYNPTADLNSDSIINVNDIVALVNIILDI